MKYQMKYRKKIMMVLVTVLVCLPALATAQTERRVQSDKLTDSQYAAAKKLVNDAELFRGYNGRDFLYSAEIVDTLNKAVRNTAELDIYVHYPKKISGGSIRKNIVRVKSGQSAGQIILQDGPSMWFYKPGTANAFRISPAQRLLGGASYADVSGTDYSQFYDPVDMEETTVGSAATYKITLSKAVEGVAYSSIGFYISKADSKPIKAEFFTPSGKLLKVMYFRKFSTIPGNVGNRTFSTEWVIVDALNQKAVTYIKIKTMIFSTLPANSYSIEGIKNL